MFIFSVLVIKSLYNWYNDGIKVGKIALNKTDFLCRLGHAALKNLAG